MCSGPPRRTLSCCAIAMVQARVSSSLKDRSSDVRRAALQIMLDRFLEKPELVPLAQQNIAGFDSPLRGLLISELSAPRKPVYKGRAASATGLDVAFLRAEDIKAGKGPVEGRPGSEDGGRKPE